MDLGKKGFSHKAVSTAQAKMVYGADMWRRKQNPWNSGTTRLEDYSVRDQYMGLALPRLRDCVCVQLDKSGKPDKKNAFSSTEIVSPLLRVTAILTKADV